jgi:hypothetical protein
MTAIEYDKHLNKFYYKEKELSNIWVEFGYKPNLKKVQVPTRS